MAQTINAKVEWLEDSSGKVIVPYTTTSAVFNENGSSLNGLLADYNTITSKSEEQLKGYYVEASAVKKIINTPQISTYMANCSTEGDQPEKVITIADDSFKSLKLGDSVIVKYVNTNTAQNCTLNVNNLGAKQIWYSESIFEGDTDYVCGRADHYIKYVYDGTYWVWMGHCSDEGSGSSSGLSYGICNTEETSLAKEVTIDGFTQSIGVCLLIKFTNSVKANSTLNINSLGAKPIYYNNQAIRDNVIVAGNTALLLYDGTNYVVMSVDQMAKVSQTITDKEDEVPSCAAVQKMFQIVKQIESVNQ